MSYSYGQFTSGESYSTPPTPIEGFPQWETVEREQEQQQQLHQQQLQHQQPLQQQQQLQQSQEEQQQHSPTQPTPTFQLIHLEDAHSQSMESNQPPGSLESGTIDDAPIHLHHVHHDPRSAEGRLETPRDDFTGMIGFIDHQASSSSASGAAKPSGAPASASTASGPSSSAMVVRSARSTRQYVQSLQPYGRPQSAASGRGPSTVPAAAGPSRSGPMSMREAQVSGPGPLRFVHHNLAPGVAQVPVASVAPSALPSAMPSPASTSGRVMNLGSVASSPVAQLQQSTLLHASPRIPDNPPPPMQQPMRKSYTLRTDTHYDPETGVLLATLELPGVEKKDIKLSLSTARHNRVKQLTVWGVLNPAFPVPSAEVVRQFPGSCIRERKFGEFSKSFSVPSDLKREDVQAWLKRGILTLKIHLGPPVEAQDVQEIPIN